VILGAAYSLWLVKRVFYGEVANNATWPRLKDLDGREWIMLTTPGRLHVLGVGIWPYPLIEHDGALDPEPGRAHHAVEDQMNRISTADKRR
jgi:NADH:ubiquinone oxidoreductase subunit 4 (subunit M)